jgi:hypothetical protein
MERQNIPKLRRKLALSMAAGKINDTLRKLKAMPISQLEAMADAEMMGMVDNFGLDEKGKK